MGYPLPRVGRSRRACPDPEQSEGEGTCGHTKTVILSGGVEQRERPQSKDLRFPDKRLHERGARSLP